MTPPRVPTSLALILCTTLAACGSRSPLRDDDASAGSTADVPPGPCPIAFDDTVRGTLQVTADDQYRLYLTGRLIDDLPRLWSSPQQYSVQLFRHPSRRNAIAIEATNTLNQDGRDRGVLVDLRLTVDGQVRTLVTDTSWRLTTQLVAGWFDVDFTAPGWSTPVDEGAHPIGPWGPVFGTSTARWLWSFDSNRPAASKPIRETVWVRRAFYFGADGAIRDTPGPCP